jgi:hypothetical protein
MNHKQKLEGHMIKRETSRRFLTAMLTLAIISPATVLADPGGKSKKHQQDIPGYTRSNLLGDEANSGPGKRRWRQSNEYFVDEDDNLLSGDDDQDRKARRSRKSNRDDLLEARQRTVFTDAQRGLLDDLLNGRRQDNYRLREALLQGRLQNQGDLPPGIRKRLARGKGLPPGIAKQMRPMPSDLNAYLGLPNDPNIRVGVLDRDLVMYDNRNNTILDILRNVFRGSSY